MLLLKAPPHTYNKILRENGTSSSALSPVGRLKFHICPFILLSEDILHRNMKISLVIRQKGYFSDSSPHLPTNTSIFVVGKVVTDPTVDLAKRHLLGR